MESEVLRKKHCISINMNQLQFISIVAIWLLNNCACNATRRESDQ